MMVGLDAGTALPGLARQSWAIRWLRRAGTA